MTSKYIHRIDTMDGVIEYESDIPPPPHNLYQTFWIRTYSVKMHISLSAIEDTQIQWKRISIPFAH
jgi:hypothetical protein